MYKIATLLFWARSVAVSWPWRSYAGVRAAASGWAQSFKNSRNENILRDTFDKLDLKKMSESASNTDSDSLDEFFDAEDVTPKSR